MADLKKRLEKYKTLLGILAVVATSFLFALKALDGWLSVDMDVSVSATRMPYRKGIDVLTVSVDLKKGARGALKVVDASVRISCPSVRGQWQIQRLHGSSRIWVADDSLRWDRIAKRPYSISAGEKLQLASVFIIPSDAIVFVDASLVGHGTFLRTKRKHSQWNASTVSVPTVDTTKLSPVANGAQAPRCRLAQALNT